MAFFIHTGFLYIYKKVIYLSIVLYVLLVNRSKPILRFIGQGWKNSYIKDYRSIGSTNKPHSIVKEYRSNGLVNKL